MLFFPSSTNILHEIDGSLLVHSGFWKGAKLSFSFVLSSGDPSSNTPYVRLNNPALFHPLVCSTEGTIATFKTASTNPSQLAPLAQALHRLFYSPLAQVIGACDKVLNEEAAILFQEDKEAFAGRVKKNLENLALPASPSPYLIQTPQEWTPHLQDTLERILNPQYIQSAVDSFEVDPNSSLAIQATE
jgi:ubiquitin-protein ligase